MPTLKHSPQVRLPDISLVVDKVNNEAFDQTIRLIQDGYVKIYDDLVSISTGRGSSLPTASNDLIGKFFLVSSSGKDDTVYICIKNYSGNYEFIKILPITSISDDQGNVRWNMSSDGERTLPAQPAFFVEANNSQDNLAINTVIEVIFNTERFDIGGNFASNTFTAPVTGKYVLSAMLLLTNMDSAARYEMKIVTSNRSKTISLDPRQFAGDVAANWPLGGSFLFDMDSSDTCTITIQQIGGSQQTDIDNATFTGFLAV